ncbi:MAG: alpha-hydroxy acid oxidase [Actinobacteria bacterium]|nr:alpha-hydroxy acid oxidase [Actinomycetota bacterium]
MTQRRRPRWSEIEPMIGLRAPFTGPDRVQRAATIADLREIARRRTPRAVFDYTDGAAGEELSLGRSRESFRRVEFRAHVLRDVAQVDTSVTVLGAPSALPFMFSPTGFTRMMHHEGEPAVARVAAEFGIPYVLSTLGTTSVEDLAAVTPDARRWFQLYLWREKVSRAELVQRVADSGYEALMLTVDTVTAGSRLRDVRNGLTIPPQLSLRTLAGMARFPRWWGNLLTSEPLEFASLRSTGGTVADLINGVFDPSITLEDVQWLQSNWSGKLIIKGVQSVEDAVMLADAGVDAIVLSNHGGRQIDRGAPPLELLPDVRAAIGDRIEVYIDGGIMNGADAVAAVGLGADAVLVGRAYLYGVMAGGEAGVRRAAQILQSEVEQTMRLLGIASLAELTPGMVSLRPDVGASAPTIRR